MNTPATEGAVPMGDKQRNLTDDDVDAIVEAFSKKMRDEFYKDLGRGVWAAVKKVLILALCAVAAYGYYSHK